MDGIILLNASENTKQVEEEEKARFVKSVLEEVGIPLVNVWDDADSLTIENKIKLRNVLSSFGVNIIDDLDGGLQVYIDREMVAEWKKPTYKLCRDHNQIDRKKQLYLEMTTKSWSVFENK